MSDQEIVERVVEASAAVGYASLTRVAECCGELSIIRMAATLGRLVRAGLVEEVHDTSASPTVMGLRVFYRKREVK